MTYFPLNNKKAQNWSIEVIIALSVFTTVFIAVLVIMLQTGGNEEVLDVERESIQAIEQFRYQEGRVNKYAFLENNKVNVQTLETMEKIPYDQLKNELGIKDDFCILLVNSSGSYRTINGKLGVGSDKVTIQGYQCGNIPVGP